MPLCGKECYLEKKFHNLECPLLANTPSKFKMRVDFNRET